MEIKKYIDINGLHYYHNLLIKQVKSLIQLYKDGQTNCPNCGAIIESEQCKYCGTNFIKWFEVK